MQSIQSLLELPRPELLQLLYSAPSLLVLGPGGIELQMQRAAWGLGLSAAAPQALTLLRVLPALGVDALLDHHMAEQKVRLYTGGPSKRVYLARCADVSMLLTE
jgi:hypothetical protein